jgi:hypothetical protein
MHGHNFRAIAEVIWSRKYKEIFLLLLRYITSKNQNKLMMKHLIRTFEAVHSDSFFYT